jgi:TatD DNase family protein
MKPAFVFKTPEEAFLKLIDTHAHLDEIADLRGAILRAKDSGVQAIVGVGSDLQSNEKILHLTAQYPDYVLPALGLHPWRLEGEDLEKSFSFIEGNLSPCIALGEIGLDFAIHTPKEKQREVLKVLLHIARQKNKPVLLHARRAWAETLELLVEQGIPKAVFHWYSGPTDVLKQILEQGYLISATPAAMHSDRHRQALRAAPLERILLETDAPEVYQGKASEPKDLTASLQAVSELKGERMERIAAQALKNTLNFFSLP